MFADVYSPKLCVFVWCVFLGVLVWCVCVVVCCFFFFFLIDLSFKIYEFLYVL